MTRKPASQPYESVALRSEQRRALEASCWAVLDLRYGYLPMGLRQLCLDAALGSLVDGGKEFEGCEIERRVDGVVEFARRVVESRARVRDFRVPAARTARRVHADLPDDGVRRARVLAVLQDAGAPLGLTELARRINEPWSKNKSGQAAPHAVARVLTRMGLEKDGAGRYSAGTMRHRESVISTLHSSSEPLGATEIARRINEPWCQTRTGEPSAGKIKKLLRQIEVQRVGEKYLLSW